MNAEERPVILQCRFDEFRDMPFFHQNGMVASFLKKKKGKRRLNNTISLAALHKQLHIQCIIHENVGVGRLL